MNTLQATAISEQCAAIRKEARDKYELMDWALEQRDWTAAYDLLERGDNLMKLAARLEMRQAKAQAEYALSEAERKRLESLIALTENEMLNRSAGLS